MSNTLRPVATAMVALSLALPAAAATIAHPHLTASTALGQYFGFSVDQMVDGITADSPFNGYASGLATPVGRITIGFDALYDLEGFLLWNDINILDEGVRSFTLSFEGEGGVDLGSTGVFTAVSQFDAQSYSFGPVARVQRVHMDVLTSNLQIEIRELAFNGELSGAGGTVPEPGSLLLAAAALCAAAGASRVSARK